MKVLINIPYLKFKGGVANHYLGLKDYWTEDVRYNQIGKKHNKLGSGKYRLPIDLIKFIFKIIVFNPDMVLVNPSLSRRAIVRDLIFLKIAHTFHKKTAVFFHGFDEEYISNNDTSDLVSWLNRSSTVFVLASQFANILKAIGVTVPINVVSTKVDDKLVSDFNIEDRNGNINNLLFLARITEQKGIFIALDIYKILLNNYPNLKFKVVGDGPALNMAKNFCETNDLSNVVFTGAVSGKSLIKEYRDGDIYIFPTFHKEGMPTSVLEAMAFGLPTITRQVGGLVDFFENGKMGKMVDSLKPEDFVPCIEKYLNDRKLSESTSIYNFQYAKKHFMASNVAKNIERILRKYI